MLHNIASYLSGTHLFIRNIYLVLQAMKLKKIIELTGVDVFNGKKLVLEQIDFDLIDAEFCYLIGNSGSGKSSLCKALYGDSRIQNGKAAVCNTDLFSLSRRNLPHFRRKLGIIFQDFHLFNGWTAEENLEYVLKATGWEDEQSMAIKIQEVLEYVRLSDKLSEKVHDLSGGEQQRLVIARAILNDPELIIADEPTGNLDQDSSDEIIQLIKNITSKYKTATVFATHDKRLLEKYPARTVLCENNALKEL